MIEGHCAQGRQKAQPLRLWNGLLASTGSITSTRHITGCWEYWALEPRINGNMWRMGVLPTGPQQLPQNLEHLLFPVGAVMSSLFPVGCPAEGLG